MGRTRPTEPTLKKLFQEAAVSKSSRKKGNDVSGRGVTACSFTMDRSTPHRTLLAGLRSGCQFATQETLEYEGKHWCIFHLPEEPKSMWGAQQRREFHHALMSLIDSAVCHSTLLDLCGVVFPEAITFGSKESGLIFPNALFMGCVFCGDVEFQNVTFSGWVFFNGSRFREQALLWDASYAEDAHFDDVDFGSNVHLGDSRFKQNAYFQGARFPGNVWCSQIDFSGRAWFQGAMFGGIVYFEECSFGGETDFSVRRSDDAEVAFPTITFEGSVFRDRACFTNRTFSESVSFVNVVFHVAPEFHGCVFHQDTDLSGTTFLDRGNADRSVICGVWPQPVDAARAYRTLKRAMESLRNAEEEARFLALEQESLRVSLQLSPHKGTDHQQEALGYRLEDQTWMGQLPAIEPTEDSTFSDAAASVDLLILTVKELERNAILRLMLPVAGSSILQGYIGQETYYWGRFGAYRAILTMCSQGSHGRDGSTLAANFGIQKWNPAAVIMVGFAWGAGPVNPSQRIADVLLSTSIVPFDPRRESVDLTVPRGVQIPAGAVLLNRFRHAHGWSFKRPDGTSPDVHIGPLLSGEWLVDNPKRKSELLEHWPAAVGGEMEGTGVSSAAARFENLKEWIVVKSICDWADGGKNKIHQPLAAATAASYCHHVFSNQYALASLLGPNRRSQ